jgi:hypothetical protein
VQSAGSDIGGDQDRKFAIVKSFEQRFALVLMNIAGNDCRRQAVPLQVYPYADGGVLGVGENNTEQRFQ